MKKEAPGLFLNDLNKHLSLFKFMELSHVVGIRYFQGKVNF